MEFTYKCLAGNGGMGKKHGSYYYSIVAFMRNTMGIRAFSSLLNSCRLGLGVKGPSLRL